jgi:serine/threonine protein phosphatase PrpC
MTDFMVATTSIPDSMFEPEREIAFNVLNTIIENIQKEYIYHDCLVKQLDKGQDFCKVGKGRDSFGEQAEFDYCIVMDGHGDQHVYTSFFRATYNVMDFDALLGTENPVQSIAQWIEKQNHSLIAMHNTQAVLRIGSTLSIAKIYSNADKIKVVCYNVGDSRIAIFENGKRVYINKPHNIGLESEKARLASKIKEGSAVVNEECKFELVNTHTLRRCVSDRVSFYYGKYMYTSLIPTQCMGHLGITGLDPEVHVAEYDASVKLRIVGYSDGIDDMLCEGLAEDEELVATKSCGEIMDKIVERWANSWTIENTRPCSISETTRFSRGDDCSICIWDNYSLI